MTTSQHTPATENQQEEWRAVPGWHGVIEVSDRGNVRRRSRDGSYLRCKVWVNTRLGYCLTYLGKDDAGKYRQDYVHRLVALAWHGEPLPGQLVRHRDGNGVNNTPTNLCWGTHRENYEDSVVHGTAAIGERNGLRRDRTLAARGEGQGNAKLTEAQVREIRALAAAGESSAAIAAAFPVAERAVRRIIARKQWAHVD